MCYGRIVLPLAFILWSGNGSGVDSWEVGRVVMFGGGESGYVWNRGEERIIVLRWGTDKKEIETFDETC